MIRPYHGVFNSMKLCIFQENLKWKSPILEVRKRNCTLKLKFYAIMLMIIKDVSIPWQIAVVSHVLFYSYMLLYFKFCEKNFGFEVMAGKIRAQGPLFFSWRAKLQHWCVGYSGCSTFTFFIKFMLHGLEYNINMRI